MNTAMKLLAMGMVSLLPLSALAADTPKTDSAAKPAAPAATELHGFDKYWSMMDPTGKGFLTKDEWLARAADRFKEIDTNADGKISKDEMKAYDDKMMQHRKEMAAQYKKKNQKN